MDAETKASMDRALRSDVDVLKAENARLKACLQTAQARYRAAENLVEKIREMCD